MIGKQVTAFITGDDGEIYSAEGVVEEVYFTTTGAYLRLDDDTEVSITDVVNVKTPEE